PPLFFLRPPRPPPSPLFPYTTLFRSPALDRCRFGDPLLCEQLRERVDALHRIGADRAGEGVASRGWERALSAQVVDRGRRVEVPDRKSTRLNSSHVAISYAVFCLKKK